MRLKKLDIGIGATAAAVALGTGVAVAVWSASGSGAGSGRALSAQSLGITAISQIGPSGSSLYPGGPAGWVYITVQNPNPYAVTVTGLAWGTPTSGNPTSCASSNISVDANAPTSASILIPANTSNSGAFQINGVLDLAHSAPDGCQGVTFTVPVTVTGVQQ